jgi:hypothetical protein
LGEANDRHVRLELQHRRQTVTDHGVILGD